MKKLLTSYCKALSSLDGQSSSWKSCVIDLWIAIGIPISAVVLLVGMLATSGVTKIHVLGVDRSGMDAFIATVATITIAIPLIFTVVGSIMWFDHRFLRWPWRKSHSTKTDTKTSHSKKPNKAQMATPRKPSD